MTIKLADSMPAENGDWWWIYRIAAIHAKAAGCRAKVYAKHSPRFGWVWTYYLPAIEAKDGTKVHFPKVLR